MNYVQFVEKVCFYKKEQILYPYPPAPFPRKGGNTGTGVPATRLGAMPQTPFLIMIEVYRQSGIMLCFFAKRANETILYYASYTTGCSVKMKNA